MNLLHAALLRLALLGLVLPGSVLPGSGAFAADPFFFVQTSDPQFGMYTKDAGFAQETANWEFVIANVNRLKPAFLIVCGDLTNKTGDADQIAEYQRINRELEPAVHLYSVAGNHDVGNDPTPETLAVYRKTYGRDYYSFREGPIYGIVVNSSLMKAPGKVPMEAVAQEKWIEEELNKAKAAGIMPVIFQHIPYFLETPDEADQYFNLPMETRKRMLALYKRYGVHYIFAGHFHRNAFGRDGDLEMTTTGPVGMPLGPDPSGIRVARWENGRIEHKYYGLGNVPGSLQ